MAQFGDVRDLVFSWLNTEMLEETLILNYKACSFVSHAQMPPRYTLTHTSQQELTQRLQSKLRDGGHYDYYYEIRD